MRHATREICFHTISGVNSSADIAYFPTNFFFFKTIFGGGAWLSSTAIALATSAAPISLQEKNSVHIGIGAQFHTRSDVSLHDGTDI